MKNILLTLVILNSVMLVRAQTDIIYPAEGGNIIFNCKITEVKNGNNVYYTKDSVSDVVIAVAITKDGNYIDLSDYVKKMNIEKSISKNSEKAGLYMGHDYEYYQLKYKRATGLRGFGAIFTLLGVGAAAVSLVPKISEDIGNSFLIGGVVLFNVGLPLWISGGIIVANNKDAMKRAKSNNNLSFRSTNNGVGLVFNF